MIYILTLCHIYFTVKLRFVQRYTFKGIRHTFKPSSKQNGIGTYSAFAAALGTTVGAGNITGVAVAISTGGAGSVFWMWLSGILAMSTKYAESYLAVTNGTVSTVLKKIGRRRLSFFWILVCGLAGLLMGSAVPSNSLASAVPIPNFLTGVLLSLAVAVTVSFGVSGISKIADMLVPVMTLVFCGYCIAVTAVNITSLPAIFRLIIGEAFSRKALVGGTLGTCIKCGITRGLYSNESGLGSGGVLAAESGDSDSVMSSLSAMTTVFWDTVVMCALTGVMFLSVGDTNGKSATQIMTDAFYIFPIGRFILPLCMTLFVFASIIGWYYIAHRVLSERFKNTAVYDIMFVISVFSGALLPQTPLWRMADGVNILMLLPSLYVLIKMSDKILYIKNKKC